MPTLEIHLLFYHIHCQDIINCKKRLERIHNTLEKIERDATESILPHAFFSRSLFDISESLKEK